MATKEENQVLINQFVEKNVDAINTLESAKQKAVLDAIIMIQNKFGTIKQTTFKDDKPKKSKAKTTSTTSTTSTLPSGTSGTSGTSGSSAIVMPSNNDDEIKDLEEAIEAQKLLLSFAETKEEKDEIKEWLKYLRSQLKKLKK